MLQILLAILAGILTVGAPCVLPLLPILLGTSIGQTSRTRPIFIVAGFVLVFGAAGLLLSWLTTHLGLSTNILREAAIVGLIVFGLLMIWPKPFELLALNLSGAVNRAGRFGSQQKGNGGGFLLGMVLGLVWTPCAGPVLGAILTLIATQNNLVHAGALLIAYAVGAGIPMLVIAYGSQVVTTKIRGVARYSVLLQQIFGVLIIAFAISMFLGYDLALQTKLAVIFPTTNLENSVTLSNAQTNPTNNTQPTMEDIPLKDYGPAPKLVPGGQWFNSQALNLENLKGKVVLVDFWTYSCINCLRTMPFVTRWYDTYKDKGFVILGIHTPEFGFEKDPGNVADAIKRLEIKYPVMQDNNYATWNNYGNQYWPAEYLVDKTGEIRYTHFGEGNYDHTENAIRELLGLNTDSQAPTGGPSAYINSPEMYLGTDRLANLDSSQKPSAEPQDYQLPQNLKLNTFALEGKWYLDPDKAVLVGGSGKIRLHFSSGKAFMVASSPNAPITLKITVDGKPQPDVTVSQSQLYPLFDSSDYQEHIIDIEITAPGLQAFTFTFG